MHCLLFYTYKIQTHQNLNVTHLPAADDSFTGERQVQEASSDLKGQRVLQGVAIDDEGHVVLLAQQISKVSAVLRNGCPGRLKRQSGGGEVTFLYISYIKTRTEIKSKFLEVRMWPFQCTYENRVQFGIVIHQNFIGLLAL